MSKVEPRLPEIGEYVRGEGTLIAVQDIIPRPPPIAKDYIFEEISARIELRLGDEVLDKVCTLWDACGKETSVATAIKEARQYASKRKIGRSSELEVVVIKTVEQVRKRPQEIGENFYDKRFYLFGPLEFGSKANLPDPVENVVWSSREVEP